MNQPWILGISGSHNGSYCLLRGNTVVVAIQEERLSGLKRSRVFPGKNALGLQYCLETAGITIADLSLIAVSSQLAADLPENDPLANPDLQRSPSIPVIHFSHHLSHAASVIATSGFERSAVLVVDGLGSPIRDLDDAARSVVLGEDKDGYEHMTLYDFSCGSFTALEVHSAKSFVEETPSGMWHFFTLGGMFAAASQHIFGDPTDAGKVMGLAPYGKPDIPTDEFLVFEGNSLSFPNRVQQRFQSNEHWPLLPDQHISLAASTQSALDFAIKEALVRLRKLSDHSALCLAGGVALNSVTNQITFATSGFDNHYVISAAEDSGVALGAAYLALWSLQGFVPSGRHISDSYGKHYSRRSISQAVTSSTLVTISEPPDLNTLVARRLANGEIGGWFQGGAELGPRALGHRSILSSPCGDNTKDAINARVKFREAFRPFAPTVLSDYATEWFDFGTTDSSSPFMLRVIPFRESKQTSVPAVVHVDGTGRVQTLDSNANHAYYDLLHCFFRLTGVPLLLNTSMNVRGEPIVETPEDALWCLLGTDLDFLVVHDLLLTKSPEFKGVLSLVPQRSYLALNAHLVNPVHISPISPELCFLTTTVTPWGVSELVLSRELAALLEAIDGSSTGQDLLEGKGQSADPLTLTHQLLLLRRMRLITLRTPQYLLA